MTSPHSNVFWPRFQWVVFWGLLSVAGLAFTGARAGEIAEAPPGALRAPIRSSHGIPTLKVSIDFGFAVTVGNFALDPQLPSTLVSPSWLSRQGVVFPFFVDRRAARVPWAYWRSSRPSGKRTPKPVLKRGEALPLFVFQAKVAGVPLELKSIVPVESVLKVDADGDPLCCDGVLGRDFFEQFRVEFRPGEQPVALLEDPQLLLDEKSLKESNPGGWTDLPQKLSEQTGPSPLWDFESRWIWDVAHARLWRGTKVSGKSPLSIGPR